MTTSYSYKLDQSDRADGVIEPKHNNCANDGNEHAVEIEAGDARRTDGLE